jgi:hypothetical protein
MEVFFAAFGFDLPADPLIALRTVDDFFVISVAPHASGLPYIMPERITIKLYSFEILETSQKRHNFPE